MKSLLPSLFILAALISMFSYMAINPHNVEPDSNGFKQYAILFPPGTKQIDILSQISSIDGVIIRMGTFPFIVIAASNNEQFLKQIKNTDALFSFSPIIKGGCIIENQGRFKSE